MNRRIILSAQFVRHWKTRISPHESLVEAYRSSLEAFKTDPQLVDDHALEEPLQDRRAFWVNHDYRVVYKIKGDAYLLVDIGTHAQVYQR